MRTGITLCVQVLIYAYRYYFMRTGTTLCVQVLIYAYRYYFMRTGITLCVQVLIYAYRYYFMRTGITLCAQVLLYAFFNNGSGVVANLELGVCSEVLYPPLLSPSPPFLFVFSENMLL